LGFKNDEMAQAGRIHYFQVQREMLPRCFQPSSFMGRKHEYSSLGFITITQREFEEMVGDAMHQEGFNVESVAQEREVRTKSSVPAW
jgi:hypothetical protein